MYKILAKHAFPSDKLHYLPSCHSTNEVAQLLVKEGVDEGTVVITDDQMAGKGQGSNLWHADLGMNLTFSMLLKPVFLKPNEQFQLTIAVSLAIKEALDEILPGNVLVKWPNDIYFKGKKISGILIENILRGNTFDACIIGVGLNVNQEKFPKDLNATSIKIETQVDCDKNTLFNSILENTSRNYNTLLSVGSSALKKTYHSNLLGIGEERQYRANGREFTGVIQATDEYGRLIIRTVTEKLVFQHKEVEMLF